MRAVVQRAETAKVTVEERQIAEIGKGILIFLGIAAGDKEADADYLLEKIINLRIFEDEQGKMNLSLLDIDGEMLVVSQFTLLGDCRNGRRPSFIEAEKPEKALFLYEHLISQARKRIPVVVTGEFQAMMKVQLVNDGPVTMLLDSRRSF